MLVQEICSCRQFGPHSRYMSLDACLIPYTVFEFCLNIMQDGQEPAQCTVSSSVPGKGGAAKGPSKGAAGGSAIIQLDAPWVLEHATQVRRMLPGGGCDLLARTDSASRYNKVQSMVMDCRPLHPGCLYLLPRLGVQVGAGSDVRCAARSHRIPRYRAVLRPVPPSPVTIIQWTALTSSREISSRGPVASC